MRMRIIALMACCVVLLPILPQAIAQTCLSGSAIDDATRATMENAAKQFFQMAQRSDTATLKQNAIPEIASSFDGIAAAVNDNKDVFTGSQATVRGLYLLDNPAPSPNDRAFSGPKSPDTRVEFFCGIYNSPERVSFVFSTLPPGRFAIAMMDVTTGKAPYVLSLVLQQASGQWKLGGFYFRATQVGGHDGTWFRERAREYAAKGQRHNAWFYYIMARELLAPLPFMSTQQLDKLYDEAQPLLPGDLPYNGPVDLSTGTKTYKVVQLFPTPVADTVYIVAKYQVTDASDTSQAFKDNMDVIKALVTRYPEYREAFAGVVARAMDPSGRDYGSLLAMKDVK